MTSVYLISLIVGGFFVVLSMLGGESDSDADIDVDADADVDIDVEADLDADVDTDLHAGSAAAGGVGLVDLLSVRFLFLFAAFFGLTGTLMNLADSGEPFTAIASIVTGLAAGLGGNYFIKTVGYRSVSSEVTSIDLIGSSAQVTIPFSTGERGKIKMISGGRQVSLVAEPLQDESDLAFNPGDDVVVVGMKGSVAEVVKPD